MPNKSTDQLIEEAVERLKKIRSTHGTYCGSWHDMDNFELDLCGECQAIKEFIDKKVEPFLTKQLNLIATKSAERLEEEIMMLFVDVDAGGQVTEKETITINDVRKLFEALSKPKE